MGKSNQAFITQTKLNNDSVKDVKIAQKRTLTYVVNVGSAQNLKLPYAVIVNGIVQEDCKNKAKIVIANGGRITVKNINPGAQVALFLNSDAHPKFRKNPVFLISLQDKDVLVNITEKPGKSGETDNPVKKPEGSASVNTGLTEVYYAFLTGDTWMKVSHKYTLSEVDDFLPVETSPFIRECVRKIYVGLSRATLDILVPPASSNQVPRTISIIFEDGKNPHENISRGYTLLAEGLTRVHPAGYAAILNAAIDAQVNKVVMSSAWRPIRGSIAHRAGLGLDVIYVGSVNVNRQALRNESAVKTSNVSSGEKELLHKFEAAKVREREANKEFMSASADVKSANGDSQKIIVAKQRVKSASEAQSSAASQRKEAELAWSAERDKNEPREIREFRASLIKNKNVAQIFDPWLMDVNNRDSVQGTSNMQLDENEKLHAHHLHVTIYEPNIL